MAIKFKSLDELYSKFLGKLSYPQKFTILSSIFLLSLGLIGSLLFVEKMKVIHIVSKEIEGVRFEQQLIKVMDAILHQKIAATLYKLGNEEIKKKFDFLQLEIDKALNILIDQDAKNEVIFGTGIQELRQKGKLSFNPIEIKESWNLIMKEIGDLSLSQIEESYNNLLYHITGLIEYTANTTSLNVDPESINIFFIKVLTTYIPDLQNLITQAITLVDRIIKQNSSTPFDNYQLISLISLISNNLDEMDSSLREVIKDVDQRKKIIIKEIEPILAEYSAEVFDLVSIINAEIVKMASINLLESDYLEPGMKILKLGQSCMEQADKILERLLMDRKSYLIRQVILSLGFSVLINGIGFFLGLNIMHRISRPLMELFKANKLLAMGNLSARVPITSYDEVGQVSQSFNSMASTIEEYSHDLEKKVADRTSELNEKNIELGIAFDKLQTMQKQVIQQEKLASLGFFAQGLSHEIQNPINFVKNFSELSIDLVEEITQYMRAPMDQIKSDEVGSLLNMLNNNILRIQQNGVRISSIVKAMQDHAKVGKGSYELVNLHNIVNETLDVIKSKYAELNININFEINLDDSIDKIYCFSQDLRQVFFNVIDNSFDAMIEKMKKLKTSYVPTLMITTKQQDKDVIISIKDNGIGIYKANLEQVFLPFYTTKTSGTGNIGLGLSIAYSIIQEHKGEIIINSEKEKFTEIKIKIPKNSINLAQV